MISVAASDFRLHLHKYLEMARMGKEFAITLRGKEVARVEPPAKKMGRLDELAKTATIGDIVSPVSTDWESM